VLPGETDVVPATARPEPTFWSICTLVASVTFQSSVADSPDEIEVGLAEKATIDGAVPEEEDGATAVQETYAATSNSSDKIRNSFLNLYLPDYYGLYYRSVTV
jgi:hypothetical protein